MSQTTHRTRHPTNGTATPFTTTTAKPTAHEPDPINPRPAGKHSPPQATTRRAAVTHAARPSHAPLQRRVLGATSHWRQVTAKERNPRMRFSPLLVVSRRFGYRRYNLPSNAPELTNHSQSLAYPTATHRQLMPEPASLLLLTVYSHVFRETLETLTSARPFGAA